MGFRGLEKNVQGKKETDLLYNLISTVREKKLNGHVITVKAKWHILRQKRKRQIKKNRSDNAIVLIRAG